MATVKDCHPRLIMGKGLKLLVYDTKAFTFVGFLPVVDIVTSILLIFHADFSSVAATYVDVRMKTSGS